MKSMLELFEEIIEAHHDVAYRLEDWVDSDDGNRDKCAVALYDAEVVLDGLVQSFKKRLVNV